MPADYLLQVAGKVLSVKRWAAMGSPVSPVVANLYMEFFEEIAIRTAEHPPRFCVMKKTEVEAFLSHLSSIRPTIMFTMEQQEDDNLTFLDSLLH